MFNLFSFRKPAPIDLTNAIYQRWLRAQKPPFEMFASLSELEQEQLAVMGDDYAQDMAIAVAIAVANPQAASDGVGALHGDVDSEASMALQMAQGMAARTQPEQSFSGFGGSKQRSANSEVKTASSASASFMGQPPDQAEAL